MNSPARPDRREDVKQPLLTEPGSVVVERGRTGTHARAGRSTLRRHGAALGDVPALIGRRRI